MQKKSSLKTLGTTLEAVVSNPSAVSSLFISNKSSSDQQVTIVIRRGAQTFTLFNGPAQAGSMMSLFEDKNDGVNIEGADSLEASASSADSVDIS